MGNVKRKPEQKNRPPVLVGEFVQKTAQKRKHDEPTRQGHNMQTSGTKRAARGQTSMRRRTRRATTQKTAQKFDIMRYDWVIVGVGDIGAKIGDNACYKTLNDAKNADELYTAAIAYLSAYMRRKGCADVVPECKRAQKSATLKVMLQFAATI